MRHDALDASFEGLSATVEAPLGIAVADQTGRDALSLGPWTSGVAWSTIKVPLAIAALRNDPSRAFDFAADAIENLGNAAAERLWSQLGSPVDAARKVQSVLRESGDTQTAVESRRVRRGYTPFGQTRWGLRDQARFAARLPTLPGASQVVDFMRNLSEAHLWGLAANGFAAKGGWGPGTDGSYLVRQFAFLPTESGALGIAFAAESRDGRFETGVEAMNAMADWLMSHLPDLTDR